MKIRISDRKITKKYKVSKSASLFCINRTLIEFFNFRFCTPLGIMIFSGYFLRARRTLVSCSVFDVVSHRSTKHAPGKNYR